MKNKSYLEKTGGWKRLTKEVVYDNPWISVSHEEVLTPKNTEGIYGVVHFKGSAVGILPIDEDGNTWLVRQSRYTLDQYTWEIPEGGASNEEAPLECAKRELQEEVGLIAEDWQPLLQMHTSNSITDEVAFIFLASGLSSGQMSHEDTEDIEVLKLPFTDALKMVNEGEITDAMSVAAILKYALILNSPSQ